MDELGVSLLVDGGGTKTNDVDRIIANLEQENASVASRGGSLPGEIDVDVDPDMDGDEYTEEGELSERGSSVLAQQQFRAQAPVAPMAAPTISPERELLLKHELLFQIDRMRRKGGGMGMEEPRQLTTANSLEEIRSEHDRMKHNRGVEASVAWQRRAFMTLVSGLEMLNTKFRIPKRVNLDGWSESVQDSFEKGECDEIFEELYEKYTSKGKWPPELKLLLSLGGSAVMVQISNTMLKNTCLEQVMKQNPGMAKDFAKAAMGTAMGMSETDSGGGGLMDFIGSMFGGAMGGKPGGGPPPPAPSHTPLHHQAAPVPPMGTMRGPTNFDAMMHNLGAEAPVNRMETLSNASDSDLDDAVSFSGMSFSSRRGAGGKRVLNL